MSSSAVLLPILLLLVGLVIGAVIGYLGALARRTTAHQSEGEQVAELRAQAAQWQARAEELSSRTQVAEERAERDGSVLRALAPVRSQLEQVGARVESLEKQRAEQHAALAEQLRATALREQDLARSTASLEGALRSRSARGMWGEVELARVLEASGMMRHVDFSEQRTIGALVQRRGGSAGAPGAVGSVGSAGSAGSVKPRARVRVREMTTATAIPMKTSATLPWPRSADSPMIEGKTKTEVAPDATAATAPPTAPPTHP